MEPGDDLFGFFQVGLVAGKDEAVDFAGDAAAQADQALVVGGEEVLVDAGAKVKSFQEGGRGQLDKILKAGAILGQKREMITGFLCAGRFFLKARGWGDVCLQAKDGIDGEFLGLLVEFHRAVQVSVIGQGQGIHPEGLGALEEIAYFSGPIQQAVMAVAMQMHKRRRGAHGILHAGNLKIHSAFYAAAGKGGRPAKMRRNLREKRAAQALEPGPVCRKRRKGNYSALPKPRGTLSPGSRKASRE